MLLSTADVKINKVHEENNTATFSFEPLPQGFGHTLGNSLRRIMLTSMKGSAITQVKFDKALHKFSTIDGVKEDVVEITLNLKKVRFKMHTDNPVVGTISVTGPGKVTAGDIQTTSDFEVINKKLHIATLSDKNSKFEAELVIESGVGYSRVEERETAKVGVVLIDALFSPVVNVSYTIEPTRKGRVIDLDNLLLTVETDGGLTPEEAVVKSSAILRNFFNRFSAGEDEEIVEEVVAVEESVLSETEDVALEELPLPTRTINALKKHGVDTLHSLAELSDEEIADIKNLGEKSIKEIAKLLKKEGLRNEA